MFTCILAKVAANAQLQVKCYYLPLAVTTPVALLFLFGICTLWNNDRCLVQDSVPLHAFWKCQDNHLIEAMFVDQFLIIAVLWFASQLVIGHRAWNNVPTNLTDTIR